MRGGAWIGFVGLALLAGCSAGKDVPMAQAAVGDFHDRLNAAQFGAIYQAADPAMKGSSSEADLVKFLSAVHRKLGAFKSGSTVGWNETYNTGGHFLALSYEAAYAAGTADESFTWRINAGRAALVGYHVNSMALVTN